MDSERKIQLNLPSLAVQKLENHADENGVTVSWLLRIFLRNPMNFQIPAKLRRPPKAVEPLRRFTLCIHENKQFLVSEIYARGSNVSAHLRYLIRLYLPHLDDLDMEEVLSIKSVDKFTDRKIGSVNSRGFARANLRIFRYIPERAFWPKNWLGNLRIMWLGRSNRVRDD